jgi:diketogulonate reductase-like aldo/keto reductase
MSVIPEIKFNDGHTIPQLGFGVFLVPAEETKQAVATALATGYRHIDTAAMYGNEREVGQAIAESGIPRNELFVTSKLWHHGYDRALAEFDASAEKLGLDYLDLYLIHWPLPSEDAYVETFAALLQLREGGRLASAGVSNFNPEHLRRVIEETGVTPAINQVEAHPHLAQGSLRQFHAEHDIVTEAWSPLARGGDVLTEATVTRLAERHGKTPAEVVLRWHLQIGNVVIPKSVTPSRIRENLDVFDFELSAAELAEIESLDRGQRIGPDPAAVNG